MSDLATSIIAGTDSEQPDVAAATAAAAEAFGAYRATSPDERSAFLEAVAAEIEADKDAIIVEAVRESGLPEGRITGEVGRTTGQLRMFAGVVAQGDHQGVRVDPGHAGPHAAAPRRHPPADGAARPGRRLRREQLPARLLDRGRRHRVGARRRLPRRGQGPPGPPGHRHPGRSRDHARRREVRPPRRHLLLRARRHRDRPGARRRPAHRRGRLHRLPRRRPGPGRGRGHPRGADPGLRRDVLDQPRRGPARRAGRATTAPSRRPTSAASRWAPASSAPTPGCSSCRRASRATRSCAPPARQSPAPPARPC